MKRKIFVLCLTLVLLACAGLAVLAGCNKALTADEGAQALLDAVAQSKSFYEQYDPAEGYSYYVKFTRPGAQAGTTETYYLAYNKGNSDLEWEDFTVIQYTKSVADSVATDTTMEYFGDALPKNSEGKQAENVRENYVRAYVSKDHKVDKSVSEESYLAREEINYLTLSYVLGLFDNLDKEDIVIADGGASRAGAVVTVTFTISDESVPLAKYGKLSVRITNGRVSSIETADKDAAEPLDYLLVYASPDISMPTQYTVDAKTVYIDYSA